MADGLSKYDLLIIGGGPGGMAAALWCSDLGLSSIVIEKEAELGGQLLKTYNPILNYIGVSTANGRQMRDIFAGHVALGDSLVPTSGEVARIDTTSLTATFVDGTIVGGRAIIIATGVRRRRLGIPGETEFVGRGILDSGVASCEIVKGKQVVIVGGGDAAFENALVLSENARSVTLLHRSGNFAARREFIEQVRRDTRIKIIENVCLTGVKGDTSVESVEYMELDSDQTEVIPADALLIRIGVEPNNCFLPPEIGLDHRGYVITNKLCMTNQHLIFAIGDIANPLAPTISGAAGDAATAVKAAYHLLEASKTL